MRQKRFQKIKLAAFASITAMILACVVVRIANADNEIQLNTFAVAPERAAEPAGKSARPIRISAPTNATKELNAPQHDAEPKSQADETLVLPDQWNLALRSADGTGSHRASETEPAPKELALPGVDPETDPPDNGNNDVNQQAQADASPAAETLPLPIEPLDSVEAEAEPAEDQPETESADSSAWWRTAADQAILNRPRWVKFDLGTVLIDTLQNSPRIQGVSQRTSVAAERIVQQDAAFDPNMLFSAKGGQVNDPVGNILTTGGASRLLEPSLNLEGGFERTTRRGGTVGLSQRVGLLNSNSNFFQPVDQGNARLSLSLTQPLFARSGKVYNERLLTQARIDHRIAWQDMRSEVESRIADVIAAYWQLYEVRCHVIQQRDLLQRGQYIEQVVSGRAGFDAGRVEMAQAKQRVARRIDQLIELQAEVKKRQSKLATLIGSDALQGTETQLEMIPHVQSWFPDLEWSLRDAVVQGLQNRPEIKAAADELESAGLQIKVTRTELVPQLNAVVDAYLAALNGNYQLGKSFVDQFNNGPGYLAGLQYEMPRGRRAAQSRYREAHHRYRQRNEELRETIQRTRLEIETALIDVRRTAAQKQSKQQLLVTANDEETVLTRRWEMMAGDGGNVGVVLANLLDAQQRRTQAEREWVTARTEYQISLVDLQRAMGTLLINEAITPVRNRSDCSIEFIQNKSTARPEPTEPAAPVNEFDRFLNNLQSSHTQTPSITEQP